MVAAPCAILYEDNHLLAVVKPPNMPVQADRSGDADLLSALKQYIKIKYAKPGEVFLALCHRLDRPVGGVMVFARTSKAAARLGAQFQSRAVKKRYVAIVQGSPPASGMLQDYMRMQEGALRAEVHAMPCEGAKEARMLFRCLRQGEGEALLDIQLQTGRKHQIRAQCAAHGFPILCDQRYHPAPTRGQIALWAYALRFTHPTKGEELELFSVPAEGAFARYPTELSGLPHYRICDVLYADAEVLAVTKRAGVEVAAADAGAASLEAALNPQFGELYPVHRLDANTEGVLLFARTRQAEAVLTQALRAQLIEKYYHCIVLGAMEKRAETLTAWAWKDAAAGRLHVGSSPSPHARPIQTGYRVLQEGHGLSMLEIRLHTGRTHQIRAHMAMLGHPVLGDDKYGDREANRRMHARRQLLLSKTMRLHMLQDCPRALCYLEGMQFTCPQLLSFPD